MYVCLSVRMENLASHYRNFNEIRYLKDFSKIFWEYHVSLKSEKNNRYFTCRPVYIHIYDKTYVTEFSLEWETFHVKVVEEPKHTFFVQ